MIEREWPPRFTLEGPRILELFTGESFYSSVDAAIREAVLNAIDAVGRRQSKEPTTVSNIEVIFDEQALTVTISDNGDGMGKNELSNLFSKVGASAASLMTQSDEEQYRAIGEFGIGVLSYFLVCERFEVHTLRGESEAISLEFHNSMLDAEAPAKPLEPIRETVGTTLILFVSNEERFQRLVSQFPHWVRDVPGLHARVEPNGEELSQGGLSRQVRSVDIEYPEWIHKTNIGPPELFDVWDQLDGAGHVDVLYRGIFVDRVMVEHLWGIEGAIHVDPKFFRPKLNREGFVGESLKTKIEPVLRGAHPKILERAIECVRDVLPADRTMEWSLLKWVTLWLAVPRSGPYVEAARLWDIEFKQRKAFKLLGRDQSETDVSVADLQGLEVERIYLAPPLLNKTTELVRQAVRTLRARNLPVVQGIRRDDSFLQGATMAGGSTGDLLINHFRNELPELISVEAVAEGLIRQDAIVEVFDRPPIVKLVRLGEEAAPIVPVTNEIWINIEASSGKLIVEEICTRNEGHTGLWVACMRYAPNQANQIAAILQEGIDVPARIGPVRRQYLRRLVR